MKTLKFLALFILGGTILMSCSSDDNDPEPVNEEELITTMTVTLAPQGGGTIVTLQSRDLDGDGPNPPEVTISGNLTANTTYDGGIVLLNETENPAENITQEVSEEAEEHQFIFTTTGAITAVDYADADGNGNPVGIAFTLETGDAGGATITITLRHEPTKPNDGTLAGAGGETDIAQTFTVTVQ